MAAVQNKETASTSKDVFLNGKAIIDSAQFEDQYEMQDQFQEIWNDDIEIVFDKESSQFMIRGEYINVEKAVEQLKILRKKPENGSLVIKKPETNTESGEVQDMSNSTGQDVKQNHKKNPKKERILVTNLTPGFADQSLKQNIPIDEHVWHYLMFKHAKRVADISSKTNCDTKVVSNFSEGRVTFNLEVTTKGSTKNLEDAVEEFAQLYQSVTQPGIDEENVKLPAEWTDKEVIKLTTEVQSMGCVLLSDKVYRLIGPRSELCEAKEKVCKSLQKHHRDEMTSDELKNGSGPQKHDSNPTKYDSNPTKYDSNPTKYGSYQQQNDYGPLNFQTSGSLHVVVAQGNLVHQEVDAIVNPANSQLRHGSGAARAIADAAGYDLIKESKEYISRNRDLMVTGVMSTTAGNLYPRIKHVIHTVGPQRSNYKDDKVVFLRVQETVFNCLVYANDKLKIQSIAIPAISSGIYGVPLDIVATASFKALEEFDKRSPQKKTLQMIYFLNNDDRTFLRMRELFESLRREKYGSCVDKEGPNKLELLDRLADIYARQRITTKPDDQCFVRAISTALQHELQLSYDCKGVVEQIKKEFEKNSEYYKKFRPASSQFWSLLDNFKNFVKGSQSEQEDNLDVWISGAANAFNVQIVLVQQVGNEKADQREFTPRSERTDRQLFIARYYYKDHHHFDALVKNNNKSGAKENGENLSRNSKVDQYSEPVTKQPNTNWNHFSSLDSNQNSGPQSLEQSYVKLEKPEANDKRSDGKKVDGKSSGTAEAKSNEDDDQCIICMDKIFDQKELSCKHKFCRECIEAYFAKGQPKCPSCGKVFGVLKGDQPNGTMNSTEKRWMHLEGYHDCGTIEINYFFPDGIQGDNHPNPGQRYRGTSRTAYLPANREGKEVFGLLKRAFDAGLVFTIGRSNTTGQENVVIWNDVHHKTGTHGPYGYPDPTYLKRVKDELAAKGIQ